MTHVHEEKLVKLSQHGLPASGPTNQLREAELGEVQCQGQAWSVPGSPHQVGVELDFVDAPLNQNPCTERMHLAERAAVPSEVVLTTFWLWAGGPAVGVLSQVRICYFSATCPNTCQS